jgi:hypothetical protein
MSTEHQTAAQLIFDEAQGIESGLRNLYVQWCKPPEPPFDEFAASVFNAAGTIDPEARDQLDAIARETDLSVIEDQGDGYPLAVMKLAYASAVLAADSATDGDTLAGWRHLNSAYFWYGQLEGREWGSWEQENHHEKHTATKLIADVRSDFSRQGNLARHQKSKQLTAWVIDQYRAGSYKSPHEASHKLKDAAIEKAKELGARLSPTRAQKTVYGWLLNRQE